MSSAICENSVCILFLLHHQTHFAPPLGTIARLERSSIIIRNNIYYYFSLIVLFSLCFFNIYVNEYVAINEHIPSGGYNIYTL